MKRFGLAILLIAFLAVPAQARFVTVNVDANGNNITDVLGGFCYVDRSDCDAAHALQLPYYINVGNGYTNLVYVNGNSVLTFGSPLSPSEYTAQRAVPSASWTTPYIYAPPSGIGVADGQGGVTATGVFASFYDCSNSVDCPLAHGSSLVSGTPVIASQLPLGYSNISFSRAGDGIDVVLTGASPFSLSGFNGPNYPVTNFTNITGAGSLTSITADTLSFHISAAIANVAPSLPETSSWIMLIAGFGGIGALARRKKRMEPRHV